MRDILDPINPSLFRTCTVNQRPNLPEHTYMTLLWNLTCLRLFSDVHLILDDLCIKKIDVRRGSGPSAAADAKEIHASMYIF